MPHHPPGPHDPRGRPDRARLIALERQFLPLLAACLLPILLLPRITTGLRIGLRRRLLRGLAAINLVGCWLPVPTGAWPGPAVRLLMLWALPLVFLVCSLRLVALLAKVPRVNLEVLADRLTYSSFVTISGLGHGDILPSSSPQCARRWCSATGGRAGSLLVGGVARDRPPARQGELWPGAKERIGKGAPARPNPIGGAGQGQLSRPGLVTCPPEWGCNQTRNSDPICSACA